MTDAGVRRNTDAWPGSSQVDMKLEVVLLPVSDVDRAAGFYVSKLHWRVDVDRVRGSSRIVHLTPPGSACSVMFGTNLTSAAPGSTQFLHLVVSDIEAAHAELVANGVDNSGIFHDPSGNNNRFDPTVRVSGPEPRRQTYGSFVAFSDPDGNGWMLQEVTARLPGRIGSTHLSFASQQDLASAIRRAEAAYVSRANESRASAALSSEWLAQYIAAEQVGQGLPV
jgi:catechol 2,3-dioxygenase-like lactoylglutathione lyase family enzyme